MRCGALLFFGAALVASGCGAEKDKDNGPYMRVGNFYCMDVLELENTCACDQEPRDLETPITILYRQVMTTSGEGTSKVTVIGGGLEFPAVLDNDGYLRGYITNYAYDENISSITYAGRFVGTAGIATFHETIAANGTPCPNFLADCHLRISYKQGACCGGNNGYNVISLRGIILPSGEYCTSTFGEESLPFAAIRQINGKSILAP